MQNGVWAQIFVLIHIDATNNLAHGYFTSKAFFQFVKLDIIVFDFVVLVCKVTNY